MRPPSGFGLGPVSVVAFPCLCPLTLVSFQFASVSIAFVGVVVRVHRIRAWEATLLVGLVEALFRILRPVNLLELVECGEIEEVIQGVVMGLAAVSITSASA